MQTATEETTETKAPSITDENISQKDYERLRAGETVEVEKSAPERKAQGETADESDTSETEADENDTDEESSADGDDEATEEVKPVKKNGKQGRIEKLVKQRREAERERDLLREQLAKMQTPQPKSEAAEKPQAQISQAGEPDANDFDSAAEFYKAHAKWAVQQELSATKESERAEKLKAESESKKHTFLGKVEEFKKAHGDFEDVVASVDDIQMSLAVQQAILESDDGPELMYHLAKNSEEYERICSLPALQAAREIGRFEARISKASEEKPAQVKTKTTTKAPPPARPVNASASTTKKSLEDLSQREYERVRDEQERKRRASY